MQTHNLNMAIWYADAWHVVDDMGRAIIEIGLNVMGDMKFDELI